MEKLVRIVILDDHQSIVDGFIYRLMTSSQIQIMDNAAYGEQLLPMLRKNQVDVLLLDLSVPTSAENPSQFPMIFKLKEVKREFPQIKIIIISTFKERGLVKAAIENGVNAYIFKDDQASIQQLARIVMIVAGGGNYFSSEAFHDLAVDHGKVKLTPRQMEVLSAIIAYPDETSEELATRLEISSSTLRNILSSAYSRLGVHSRSAAIDKIRQLGIVPTTPAPHHG